MLVRSRLPVRGKYGSCSVLIPDAASAGPSQGCGVQSPRCVYCGEPIGTYEPIRVLLADGDQRRGSSLTLGTELAAPGTIVVHEGCYPDYQARRARQPPD
jgi:hypothetical protein